MTKLLNQQTTVVCQSAVVTVLFRSFKLGNASRMSDEKLVVLEFKYLQTKNGRNKL